MLLPVLAAAKEKAKFSTEHKNLLVPKPTDFDSALTALLPSLE